MKWVGNGWVEGFGRFVGGEQRGRGRTFFGIVLGRGGPTK